MKSQQPLHHGWISDGRTISVTTPRRPDEPEAAWRERHDDCVLRAKDQLREDPAAPGATAEPLPCPWPDCGTALGEEPSLLYVRGANDSAIMCTCCGMRGPTMDSNLNAAAAWNALPRTVSTREEVRDRLLHAPALARHIGTTVDWLKAEANAGRLPCLRIGTRYLFDREAVERELLRRAGEDTEHPGTTGEKAKNP